MEASTAFAALKAVTHLESHRSLSVPDDDTDGQVSAEAWLRIHATDDAVVVDTLLEWKTSAGTKHRSAATCHLTAAAVAELAARRPNYPRLKGPTEEIVFLLKEATRFRASWNQDFAGSQPEDLAEAQWLVSIAWLWLKEARRAESNAKAARLRLSDTAAANLRDAQAEWAIAKARVLKMIASGKYHEKVVSLAKDREPGMLCLLSTADVGLLGPGDIVKLSEWVCSAASQ